MGKFNFQRDWNFDQNNRLVDRDFLEGEAFDEVMQGYMPSLLEKGVQFREDLNGLFVPKRPLWTPQPTLTGPVSTDVPTITTGIAADGSFNEAYTIAANVLPTPWPVDVFGKVTIPSANTWSPKTSLPNTSTVSTYRMMADGPEVLILTYALNLLVDIYVDGQPLAANPLALGVTTGLSPYGYTKLVFGAAKPEGRLIEFRMVGGWAQVATKKPYRLWKPAPDMNPSLAVVGDSLVQPSVMNDASAGGVTVGYFLYGVYQRMAARLGLRKMVTDGIGGTGYIAPSGQNRPYNHADRVQWLKDVNPDVIVMHGGGANDLIQGNSVASIITAATARFEQLRADHPAAKLVFMEGISTPALTPATYDANYKLIREGVQANLLAAGVDAYYIDVATTRPPINGTGYVTATTGVGNSDIYVGSDGVHLSIRGNAYLRGWLAPKFARVLADDGQLLNTLI